MISVDAMDKIIEITEKNLQMQGEFLRNLMELRGRFDISDRDHEDMGQIAKATLTNSFDIINTMKAASNEKIITIAEKTKEVTADMFNKVCDTNVKISAIADAVSETDKWSKRFISIVTVALFLVQSFGIYLQGVLRDYSIDDFKKSIIEAVDTVLKDRIDDTSSKDKD